MFEVEEVKVEDKRDYSGYVRIPLPFAYIVGSAEAVDNLATVKENLTDGLHIPKTTYSQDEIQKILLDKQVQVDVPRMHWTLGKGIPYEFRGYNLHLMPSFPEDGLALEPYKNSYILAENRLRYVTFDGQYQDEDIKIEKFPKFLKGIKKINPDDLDKLLLSPAQAYKLITLNGGYVLPNPIQEMQASSCSAKANLNLTMGEAEASYAFACSTRNEDAPKKVGELSLHALQGGLFRFPTMFFGLWSFHIGGVPGGSFKEEQHITRNATNNLNVSFSVEIDNFEFSSPSYSEFMNDSDKSLLFYSNQYEINQKGENFTCTRMDDLKSNTLFIEKAFFNDYFIPAVIEELAKTDFSTNLNAVLVEHLILFVPLLSNPAFAKLFFDKLESSSLTPKTKAFLVDHIRLCFDIPPPTFWQRHQDKIILSLIGLALASVIIATSIITFGLPAILAAVGGAIAFGSIAAGSGAALLGIFVLIGKNTDDKRMLEFESIEKAKQDLVLKWIEAGEFIKDRDEKQLEKKAPLIPEVIPEGTVSPELKNEDEDSVNFDLSDEESEEGQEEKETIDLSGEASKEKNKVVTPDLLLSEKESSSSSLSNSPPPEKKDNPSSFPGGEMHSPPLSQSSPRSDKKEHTLDVPGNTQKVSQDPDPTKTDDDTQPKVF